MHRYGKQNGTFMKNLIKTIIFPVYSSNTLRISTFMQNQFYSNKRWTHNTVIPGKYNIMMNLFTFDIQ